MPCMEGSAKIPRNSYKLIEVAEVDVISRNHCNMFAATARCSHDGARHGGSRSLLGGACHALERVLAISGTHGVVQSAPPPLDRQCGAVRCGRAALATRASRRRGGNSLLLRRSSPNAVSSSPACTRSSRLALAAARSTAPSPACLARSQAPTAADDELIELPAAARAAGGQALTEPKLEHFCSAFWPHEKSRKASCCCSRSTCSPEQVRSPLEPAACCRIRASTAHPRVTTRCARPATASSPHALARSLHISASHRPALCCPAGEQLEPDTILRRRRRRLDFARAALGTSFACRCHSSPTWRPGSRRRRCRAAGWLQRPMARRRRERRLRRGTVEARRRFEEVKDSECIGCSDTCVVTVRHSTSTRSTHTAHTPERAAAPGDCPALAGARRSGARQQRRAVAAATAETAAAPPPAWSAEGETTCPAAQLRPSKRRNAEMWSEGMRAACGARAARRGSRVCG